MQATNFKVVVTLDDVVPNVRPGFTCTADIITDTRADAISVPIQATTVREMRVDNQGRILGEPLTADRAGVTTLVEAFSSAQDDGLEEIEGVFLVKDGRVQFTAIVTGIAGERYFESLTGVNEGDLVVTGPFNVVRTLKNDDAVQLADDDSNSSNDINFNLQF